MDNLILLIWLGVFGLVIYFFTIRPQQKQAREQAALMAGLTVGDEVVTASGVFGFIADMDDEVVWLEVKPNFEIKITKASIASRIVDADESDED